MNAAMALTLAPTGTVVEVMQRLVADVNSRVRLIAASSLLSADSSNASAGAVLTESLEDPALRVRAAAPRAGRVSRCIVQIAPAPCSGTSC